MNYADRIVIEPGKRAGRPVTRGLRITVYDVLDWLANGMSADEIIDDFPEIERTLLVTKLQLRNRDPKLQLRVFRLQWGQIQFLSLAMRTASGLISCVRTPGARARD